MPEKENRKFQDHIVKQSAIIKNESLLIQKWYEYIHSMEYSYLSSLFSLSKFERFFYKNGIFKSKIINNKKILSIYNKISCEAHKEVLLTILRNHF